MIAVDTNILVYAYNADSDWHPVARQCLRHLAEAPAAWALPWPCVHEFLAVVTHPRIFSHPASLSLALAAVARWLDSPSLCLIGEGPSHWDGLKVILEQGRIVGAMVHDARIAAICLQHGVTEFWTADRDFSRFPALRTRNPLLV